MALGPPYGLIGRGKEWRTDAWLLGVLIPIAIVCICSRVSEQSSSKAHVGKSSTADTNSVEGY